MKTLVWATKKKSANLSEEHKHFLSFVQVMLFIDDHLQQLKM